MLDPFTGVSTATADDVVTTGDDASPPWPTSPLAFMSGNLVTGLSITFTHYLSDVDDPYGTLASSDILMELWTVAPATVTRRPHLRQRQTYR
jgi:hypothetical protein